MQFFLLLSVLVGVFVSTKAAKPRSINLAIDTVFEFDKSSDIDFIDQIQGILTKVKNVIQNNENKSTKLNKHYKYTDFLKDIFDTLLDFNDDDLMEIVQIVEDEIRKNIQNNALEKNVRRYLTSELGRIKTKPAKTIRKNIDKLLKKVQNGKNGKTKNFLRFINTLYKRDAGEKLAKFIRNLKIFRRSSQTDKKFQRFIREAVQMFIFEHFLNLSEETKRKVETRIKDYLRDNFSTSNNGKDQPHKVELKSALVLQNSGDVETSQEIIDIQQRTYKSYHHNNNKYKPHLVLGRSGETKLSTKVFAQDNEEVEKMSIEKENKYENKEVSQEILAKTAYYIVDNVVTFTKPTRSYNSKMNKKHKKFIISNKKFITSNPEDIKMEKINYNSLHITKIPVSFNKSKIIQGKKDKTSEYGKLTSKTHNEEININLKNKKNHVISDYDKDNLNKDALMKVRSFRQKLMESRTNRNNEDSNADDSEHVNIKEKEFATPKTSVEYFGSVSKNKGRTVDQRDARRFISDNNNHAYKITEFLNQIENKTKTHYPRNKINKMHMNLRIPKENNHFRKKEDYITAKNKSDKKLKTIELSTEHDVSNNRGYRRAKEANIAEKKPDRTLETKEITDKDNRLAEELNTEENNTSIFSKNYNNPTESKLINNKPDTILKTIKTATENNDLLNNKGHKLTKKPKRLNNEVSLSITTNDIIGSKSKTDTEPNIIIHLKSTTNKHQNINRRPLISYTKADKITKKVEERINLHKIDSDIIIKKVSKTTKKTFENNVSTNRKTMSRFTNKAGEVTANFNYEVSKSDSIVTKHDKLNTDLQVNSEIKTTKIDTISFDIKDDINRQDIRPNETKINDSRRQENVNPKTTTIKSRDDNLEEAGVQELLTTEIDPISLDIKKYLKNPEVTGVEDDQKKKEIEQKIKEDLSNLFTLPATKETTTGAYTDIFEVMDNDFDLGPLK